jgi:hypothetical protein
MLSFRGYTGYVEKDTDDKRLLEGKEEAVHRPAGVGGRKKRNHNDGRMAKKGVTVNRRKGGWTPTDGKTAARQIGIVMPRR